MGCDVARWTPPGEGKLDTLSPILSSLAPVKEHVSVLTNLGLKPAYPGTHATSNAAFLSAARAKHTESTDYHLGTTVDQVAAKQLGRETPLPSLKQRDTVDCATPAVTATSYDVTRRVSLPRPRGAWSFGAMAPAWQHAQSGTSCPCVHKVGRVQ